MLPKKNLINLKTQARDGFKVIRVSDGITVKYKASQGQKGAVIITKAVAKSAVDRNRTKRIILEALRYTGLRGEFIFLVRRNISGYKTQEINELLKGIGSKIKK